MLRTAFTVWFVLTTLAGPAVCCCALPSTAGKRAVPDVSDPQVKRSCCHLEPEPTPATPPSQAPCPCKDGGGSSVVVVAVRGDAVERSVHRSVDDSPLPTFVLASDQLFGGRFALTGPNRQSKSFRTGRDILCTLHILRC